MEAGTMEKLGKIYPCLQSGAALAPLSPPFFCVALCGGASKAVKKRFVGEYAMQSEEKVLLIEGRIAKKRNAPPFVPRRDEVYPLDVVALPRGQSVWENLRTLRQSGYQRIFLSDEDLPIAFASAAVLFPENAPGKDACVLDEMYDADLIMLGVADSQ